MRLLDASDVDVVDNCLVNAEHYGPLMHAIDSGKHVFTEKPLTIELSQAERLLAAARKAGVQHGVIQNMRFNPGPRKAKELLSQGLVGRVFSADVLFGYAYSAKDNEWTTQNGRILDRKATEEERAFIEPLMEGNE